MALRVLIVGGYGVFGGRLARLLADDPRLELIVAGRSKASAERFCEKLQAQAKLTPAEFDREKDISAQLDKLGPHIVVDASGPFQGYGRDPYRLVRAAVAFKANYLDFADGSAFVDGVGQFDAEAKRQGVFVLSGVSSFPVLTAAVVRHLAPDLATVASITGGIAPSPYAGVGLNVIRAIASYAGKPLRLTRGGRPASGYALTETRRVTIAPPGRLPLRSRLFSLVDVPDLTAIPPLWPGLGSLWMGAAPVPEVLHRLLIGSAWLVRIGLLPGLSPLAPLFHRVINIVRWGEHRGGMFVEVVGTLPGGAETIRSWHLLAEGEDGPLIPSMAIETIVRKCASAAPPAAGARAAVCELELCDYAAAFAKRTIHWGVRKEPDGQSLFARILGPAFDDLPKPIRDMHDAASDTEVAGTATVERGTSVLAAAIAWVIGFPRAGSQVPVRVRIKQSGPTQTWEREFAGKTFRSELSEGSGRWSRLLVERFGAAAFAIALVADGHRLAYVVRGWRLFGMPMPVALAPTGTTFETGDNGLFGFHVEIKMPVAGLIVRYRGTLRSDTPAEVLATKSRASRPG